MFMKGDAVKCVYDSGVKDHLSKGTVYKVTKANNHYVQIEGLGALDFLNSRFALASRTPTPERLHIRSEASRLTSGDRDIEYGPPQQNMTCSGELKAIFRKYLARDISHGEQEALDMVMTKLGRLACGKPKRDTYIDGAAYFAIAGECTHVK